MNAILSDLIYARILEPCSKRPSLKLHQSFWRNLPTNSMMYIVHWMSLVHECDFIQSEVYKNSHFLCGQSNDKILYYDCQIIISRSSRKMAAKSTARAKNTGQIQSFRWACSWMGMGCPWHFLFSPGTRTSRTR